MNVTHPNETADGLWSMAVDPGHPDVLLAALDAEQPWAVIETWDGNVAWHEVDVTVAVGEEQRKRLVRRHSFDLLVTPAEAKEIGIALRRGLTARGLLCYQFDRKPDSRFDFPQASTARVDAYRGQGVKLVIDLPHDGETAVVSAPDRTFLEEYRQRLM